MKRIFAVLTISGRLLKPLLMLPYPHPAINKQAVLIKLSEDPGRGEVFTVPKNTAFKGEFRQ